MDACDVHNGSRKGEQGNDYVGEEGGKKRWANVFICMYIYMYVCVCIYVYIHTQNLILGLVINNPPRDPNMVHSCSSSSYAFGGGANGLPNSGPSGSKGVSGPLLGAADGKLVLGVGDVASHPTGLDEAGDNALDVLHGDGQVPIQDAVEGLELAGLPAGGRDQGGRSSLLA